MHKSILDFLEREEKRRNRSLPKTFWQWLDSERAEDFLDNLERVLSKKGQEFQAVQLLKKAEEKSKGDLIFKRQDQARKKAIKKFQSEFAKWMKSEAGEFYTQEIQRLLSRDDLNEFDRDEKIQTLSDEAEQAFIDAFPHLAPQTGPRPKSKISSQRRAWNQNVDDVIYRVIEPGLKQLGFIGSELFRNWGRVVGKAVSHNSRPEKILYPPKARSHGKLIIRVRSGFNTEIQHQRDEIIRRVNSYFGYQAISDLQISKTPFDSYVSTGQVTSRRIISRNLKPATSPSPYFEKMIGDVKDPALKKALFDWGRVMQSRNG